MAYTQGQFRWFKTSVRFPFSTCLRTAPKKEKRLCYDEARIQEPLLWLTRVPEYPPAVLTRMQFGKSDARPAYFVYRILTIIIKRQSSPRVSPCVYVTCDGDALIKFQMQVFVYAFLFFSLGFSPFICSPTNSNYQLRAGAHDSSKTWWKARTPYFSTSMSSQVSTIGYVLWWSTAHRGRERVLYPSHLESTDVADLAFWSGWLSHCCDSSL